jgi:hypothetical protein
MSLLETVEVLIKEERGMSMPVVACWYGADKSAALLISTRKTSIMSRERKAGKRERERER